MQFQNEQNQKLPSGLKIQKQSQTKKYLETLFEIFLFSLTVYGIFYFLKNIEGVLKESDVLEKILFIVIGCSFFKKSFKQTKVLLERVKNWHIDEEIVFDKNLNLHSFYNSLKEINLDSKKNK